MNILVCPQSSGGFLYPAVAVALELQRSGHRVTVLAERHAAARLAATPLTVVTPADLGVPAGSLHVAGWFQGARVASQTVLIERAAAQTAADVLLTSTLCLGALIAGERCDVPVAVLGLACQLWLPSDGPMTPGRSHLAWREWQHPALIRAYNEARAAIGLSRWSGPANRSPLMGTRLLLRGCPSLDQLAVNLPAQIVFVGPCRWEPMPTAADEAFLASLDDRLAGQPAVYVHLGRTFGGAPLLPAVERAFTGSGRHAVVEVGRSGTDLDRCTIPEVTLVRRPFMDPFLRRAVAVLSNATTAPVLGALAHRLPSVVSPNGSEQPVVADACVRAGVARPISDDLAGDLDSVIGDAVMAQHVGFVADQLSGETSAGRAADVVGGLAGSRVSDVGPRSLTDVPV